MQFKSSIFNPLGLLNPVKLKGLKTLFPDACYGNFEGNVLPEFFLSVFYDILYY